MKNYIRTVRYIGSTKFRMPLEVLEAYAELAWECSISRSNDGVSRQIAAIIKSRDRTQALARIKSPTWLYMVIKIHWLQQVADMQQLKRFLMLILS